MAKKVPAFLRAEIRNDATDPTQETRNGMRGRLAQMRLEFAEGQFDRVEVGRILREINQHRSRRLDRLRDAGDLVHRQIVHQYRLAALERRDQALPHISEKHRPVHGALDHKWRGHSALSQGAYEGDSFPSSVRRVVDQSLATPSASA